MLNSITSVDDCSRYKTFPTNFHRTMSAGKLACKDCFSLSGIALLRSSRGPCNPWRWSQTGRKYWKAGYSLASHYESLAASFRKRTEKKVAGSLRPDIRGHDIYSQNQRTLRWRSEQNPKLNRCINMNQSHSEIAPDASHLSQTNQTFTNTSNNCAEMFSAPNLSSNAVFYQMFSHMTTNKLNTW